MKKSKEKREIKFRVRDNNKKFIEELAYPWVMINDEILNIITGEKWENVELMQFIGAKDKNRIEIYEGDIVGWEYPYHDMHHKSDKIFGVVEWNEHNCGFEVRQLTEGFYEYGCGSRARLKFYGADRIFEFDDLEVVGNIYDNPEFLAKQKATIK